MAMHITPEWLRNKIESTSETEIEAGIPIEEVKDFNMFLPSSTNAPVDEKRVAELKHAFGLFIRNLRLTKELSIDTLAKSASIDVNEIHLIESDSRYIARPRTVYQLANFFNINVQKMMKISGASQSTDMELEEETLKFAAKSDGVSSLNNEEREVLNEYVKFLNES